jgi:hypothetical protein
VNHYAIYIKYIANVKNLENQWIFWMQIREGNFYSHKIILASVKIKINYYWIIIPALCDVIN